MTDLRQTILNFIRLQPLMVMATISSDGLPQAAVVGVAETEDLELLFGTSNQSRKYKNIQTNPRVACVIGWNPREPITVQYEGIVRELSDSELDEGRELLIKKIPPVAKFANDPNQRYFKVSPIWIRYSNFSGEKEIIEAITFERNA